MKEAVANVGVLNLIIIFTIILIAFFTGSLSYSRAFKVKNRIIEEIEKDRSFDNNTQANINSWLNTIGYRRSEGAVNCPTENGASSINLQYSTNNFEYCVYKYNTCSNDMDSSKCGDYYRVISYMYFDVPIISGLLKIPVKGETMIFNDINDYAK